MNFMFEWQKQYLTSERSERVRYCARQENIKFIYDINTSETPGDLSHVNLT